MESETLERMKDAKPALQNQEHSLYAFQDSDINTNHLSFVSLPESNNTNTTINENITRNTSKEINIKLHESDGLHGLEPAADEDVSYNTLTENELSYRKLLEKDDNVETENEGEVMDIDELTLNRNVIVNQRRGSTLKLRQLKKQFCLTCHVFASILR